MNDLFAGQNIGSYELIDVIGRTGMSEVWRARKAGQIVALKTISPNADDDPQRRTRFLREGGEHQALKHAAIVPILDFFQQDGDFFLVMQYVAGGSLEDRMEKNGWKPLPIAEALRISRQILPALDYAHQRGIIHRDVKPSNILLDGERAYLSDFGIALAVGRPRITGVSQIMGTRSYMSPEQMDTPLDVTHLTDVYSYGCVLYEILTGYQPHARNDGTEEPQYELLAKRKHEPPEPLRQWNGQIPARLERIVLTALAPNPLERFSGCGSFCRALEGVEIAKTPLPVPPIPAGSSRGNAALADSSSSKFLLARARDVSVAANVVAVLLCALAWVAFVGQSNADRLTAIIVLCFAAANILLLRLLYKAWAALPEGCARTSPGKAVGYLFIPFYSFYWCWNVVPGFARDFNDCVTQRYPLQKPQPEWFHRAFCISHFYVPVALAFLPFRALTGGVALLDLTILTPIMAGILAGAINRMNGAEQSGSTTGSAQQAVQR